jgi:hypothetical protein
MSIFSMIQNKVLEQAQLAQQLQQQSDTSGGVMAGLNVGAQTAAAQVDVEQALVTISELKGNPDLNWRTSIVDLMKLLDLDSSLSNRAEARHRAWISGREEWQRGDEHLAAPPRDGRAGEERGQGARFAQGLESRRARFPAMPSPSPGLPLTRLGTKPWT